MIQKDLVKKFPYILAWGRLMGSSDHRISTSLLSAEASNAPTDATYVKDMSATTGTGRWSTVDGIVNPNTLAHLEEEVRKIKAEYLIE